MSLFGFSSPLASVHQHQHDAAVHWIAGWLRPVFICLASANLALSELLGNASKSSLLELYAR